MVKYILCSHSLCHQSSSLQFIHIVNIYVDCNTIQAVKSYGILALGGAHYVSVKP